MTYQVIARKWRPQTFEEVTGQEHITRTLRNAVEHERLHHAYLFSGARGVGKTTTARLLAKAVNCHRAASPTPTPCRTTDADACVSCREIAESRAMDVIEIDAASHTQVDNVREVIINSIGIAPARDRYKVFIIDEVHMLSGHSFNALLKTIEEPPPRVLFIMATTHAHKVPETILSRSQQFEFRTISTAKIAERLRLIADAENINIKDDALKEIARAGEGSMRDAQSAFDQVISFSDGKIGSEDVEAALGIASAEMLSRVVRAIAEGNSSEALAVVDDLSARGHELQNFCRDLLAHLRDMLVVKVMGNSSTITDATEEERKELANEGRDFSESDLVRFFHSLTETETLLREGSAHPRYQLEIGLVKLVEMRRLAPLGQIVERLNALEEALRTGGAGGAGQPPTPSTPAGVPPRRGSAAGGGPTSFSARSSNAAPHATERANKPDEPNDAQGVRDIVPTPSTPATSSSPSTTAISTTPATSQSATLSSSASPNLKLVPPAHASSGGAVSFAGGAASHASDAPFALAPTVASHASGAGVAPAHEDAPRPRDESAESARIKRGLEERGKPLLAAALDGAKRVVIEGEEVRVEFAPEGKHLRDALMKPENMRLLREACCEALGRSVGVAVVVKAAGEADDALAPEDEARREQKRLREQVESNPAVQKMLKTFRAEIVEVRTKDIAPQ